MFRFASCKQANLDFTATESQSSLSMPSTLKPSKDKPSRLKTRFLILASLAFVFFNGSGFVNAQDDDAAARAIAQTAFNAQSSNSFAFAASNWEKLISKHPNSPLVGNAHYSAGVCYTQTNEFEKAISNFQSALTKLGDEELVKKPNASLYLGFAQYRRGQDLAQAEATKTQGIELLKSATNTFAGLIKDYPKFEDIDQACYYQGTAFEQLGQSEDAIKSYAAMLQYPKQTNKFKALYAIADLNFAAKRFDESLKYYDQFLADPDAAQHPDYDSVSFETARTLINLALADTKADKKTDSQTKLTRAVEILTRIAENPVDAQDTAAAELADEAAFQQAYCFQLLGQLDKAAEIHSKIADSNSRFKIQSLVNAAILYRESDKIEEAKTALLKVAGPNAAETEFSSEAASILADLYIIDTGENQAAFDLASTWIPKSTDKPTLVPLKMAQAEAAYRIPDRRTESVGLFQAIADQHAEHPSAPNALYKSAFAAVDVNDIDRSLEKVAKFETAYPNSQYLPDVRYVKAEALLLSDKPDEAQTLFDSLATNHPEHPDTTFWKLRSGLALYQQEKYQETVEKLSPLVTELKKKPRQAEALLRIGSSQFALKQFPAAVTSLQQAIAADNEGPLVDETLLMLCRSQIASEKGADGEATGKQLLDRFPESPWVPELRYRLGDYLYGTKKYKEALENFDVILTKYQDSDFHPYALYNAAWCKSDLKEFNDSEKLFSDLMAKYPQHELAKRATMDRGATFRKSGNYESSIKDLQAFLKTNPEGAPRTKALYEIGLAQVQLEKWNDAIGTFKLLIAETPNSPQIDRFNYELAWAYRNTQKEDLALERFANIANDTPDSSLAAESNFHLGSDAYNKDKFDEAIAAYQKCIASETDDSIREKAAYKLAWAHYKQKQYDQAHTSFAQQVKDFSKGELYADGMFMVAESLFRLKKHEDAYAAYTAAKPVVDAAENIEPKIKWLTMLHGSQSANETKKYNEAIQLVQPLADSNADLAFRQDAWLEMASAYRGLKQTDNAIKFFEKASDNLGKTGARAYCMLGDVYFADKKFDKAIDQFKQVFFGFGGAQAADDVKPWQAYALYEAGQCNFVQVSSAPEAAKEKLINDSVQFFERLLRDYSTDKLVDPAKKQLETLKKLQSK
ncbi:MAG: tetratricopeptide repeat protein [Mariniblastus sp.]